LSSYVDLCDGVFDWFWEWGRFYIVVLGLGFMKRVWKGVIVGGVVGVLFGLLLIKFASSESIFRIPLKLVLKVVCPSAYSCTDIIGFAMFVIIFTLVFYGLVGGVIGALIARWRGWGPEVGNVDSRSIEQG
jgi:hypothetical protein